MDVDYDICENQNSSIKHLVLAPATKENFGTTVCGLIIKVGVFQWTELTVKKFWGSKNACKNCKRAAKR